MPLEYVTEGLVEELKRLEPFGQGNEKPLFAQKGLMMSECVMMHLARKLGRLTAHEIVYKSCMKAYEQEVPLKQILMQTPEVTQAFTEEEVDLMLNPHSYIGLAPEFVDRVVAKWENI